MIEFKNVAKSYKNHKVIKNLNFTIDDKKITVLIGSSGCGKTTTLKMINRLIEPTSGEIFINGKKTRNINKVKLRRSMGYVIQSGGLFPHLTIRENIELISRLEGKPVGKIEAKTVELMNMIRMKPEEYLDRYPKELSGGQQQRIGIARAFANDPEIILFDEPFSALDPITRSSLQDELRLFQEHNPKTIVFVTHDMDEAVGIADKICILKDGNIVQYDTPEQILREPANDFVENFVGSQRIWSSPEYIKVEDFMITEPVTCSPDATASQCMRIAKNHRVDSLIIVDKKGHFLGIIGKKAFFRYRKTNATAGEMVEKTQYVAHPDDSILDILTSIQDTDTNNVPVVDEDNILLGLLTSSQLVATMSKQFIEEE